MAKIKNDATNDATKEVVKNEVEKASTEASTPSIYDVLDMIASLKGTIDELRNENAKLKEELTISSSTATLAPAVTLESTPNDSLNKLAEVLAGRKSDKEVVLYHNRQLLGNLATTIQLTNLRIDFHTLGEQRVLSWQQFEECVSKYRKWFDKQIILLGPGQEELSERYNVPCVKRQGYATLTMSDLQTLYRKSERELEDFMNTLTKEDQGFVCSYWLGKCYEKDEKYIVRSKIELLNRLSGKGVFNTYLISMNFQSVM